MSSIHSASLRSPRVHRGRYAICVVSLCFSILCQVYPTGWIGSLHSAHHAAEKVSECSTYVVRHFHWSDTGSQMCWAVAAGGGTAEPGGHTARNYPRSSLQLALVQHCDHHRPDTRHNHLLQGTIGCSQALVNSIQCLYRCC